MERERSRQRYGQGLPWFTRSLARSLTARFLAGYGFDEQTNGNGYKHKASKLNQTSLSTVHGTLYRIGGKLRNYVNFHPYVSVLGHKNVSETPFCATLTKNNKIQEQPSVSDIVKTMTD